MKGSRIILRGVKHTKDFHGFNAQPIDHNIRKTWHYQLTGFSICPTRPDVGNDARLLTADSIRSTTRFPAPGLSMAMRA